MIAAAHKEQSMTAIKDHHAAQERQAVKDEILDSLKLKNKPAYDMFEFEYKRALDEADKLGKLRV